MDLSFKNIFSFLGSQSDKKTGASSVVGIDIGSSSMKVVQIDTDEEGVATLRTYGELQLGPYFDKQIGEGVPFDLEKHTTALTDLLREANVTAKSMVFSMPLWSSFVSVFSVKLEKNEQIESKIHLLARKYVPISIRDVTLDWAVLNDDEKNLTKEVFLVAIQKESVERFNALMSNVGFSNYSSELEVFSAARTLASVEESGDEEYQAVIDIGASLSKLYILRNGLVEKFHRVAVGGIAITQALAKQHDLSFEEAETRKREGSFSDTELRDALQVLAGSMQEFKRVIGKYELAKAVTIKNITLSGGVSAMPHMPPLASDVLDKKIVPAHSFEAVSYPPFMEDVLKEIGPLFTNSIGGSLRDE